MNPPTLVPGDALEAHFQQHALWHGPLDDIALGFGTGNPQYALIPCAAPGPTGVLGLFFEWHTRDFFQLAPGAHLAVGLDGPVEADPHRGRGLAIGHFAGTAPGEGDGERRLFAGADPHPGGPAGFLEEFTVNEGTAPIHDWQLTPALPLPDLEDEAVVRVDIHVSARNTWAAAWRIDRETPSLLGHWSGRDGPAFADGRTPPTPARDPSDNGVGNVFIGSAFGSPKTASVVRRGWLACWRD